jgi:hypothetical protein
VKWLWRGQERRELLSNFSKGSQAEKRSWSRRLSHEAFILLKNPIGSVTPHFDKNTTPSWQKAGADFLCKFYEELYRGLPDFLFLEPNASSFSRHDLIYQFDEANNQLLVCPACDSANRTQIDHYFPISLYPHLSCHPFNLVPVCGDCNSPKVKGNTDCLARASGIRRNLEDIFLPYQGYGLGTHTYLRVELGQDYKNPSEMALKPLPGKNLREWIEAYYDAYKIPNRWFDTTIIKQNSTPRIIQNLIFRQVKQSIEAAKNRQASMNIFDVRDVLDDLLASLFEDQGQTPLAFPMVWCLTALINQQVEPTLKNTDPIEIENFPFLVEIAGWAEQDQIQHPAYISNPKRDKMRSLRKIAAEEG